VTIDTSEVRVTGASGASKGQKAARFDLIPPRVLKALAEHYGVGARKYNPIPRVEGEAGPAIDNWRLGYNYSSSLAALHRHLNAWSSGEDIDEETGSNHLVAVMWHCATLLEFQMTPGFPEAYDDRQQPIVNPLDATLESVRAAISVFGGVLPARPIPAELEPLPTAGE
jgi:hypothetical protein